MASYKVVSRIQYDGQWIDIPDDAVDVSVQPMAQQGAVQVTYLKPVAELTPESNPTPARQRYVD